jgi:hypothetical protein
VSSQKVRKPIISFTLSLDVVDLIERLCVLTGWSRSRCVEECVRFAFPEINRRFAAVKKVDTNKALDDEELRNEYWRKVLLGEIKQGEWIQQ